MARTVNPVAYATRRDAFVDAALRILQTKGYDQLSVQNVIEAVGASKGAFFHYFDSKASLLAAVIDRMVEMATENVAPIASDPSLGALEKLQGVFGGMYQWKSAQPQFQPDVIAPYMRTWFSDENSVVLERMRAAIAERLTPLLGEILREGVLDGSFKLTSAEGTATVVTSILLGLNEVAVRLFLGRRDGNVTYETVTCTLDAYYEAMERTLGIPPTSWPHLDDETVRYWFG